MDLGEFNKDLEFETDDEILAEGADTFECTLQFMMLHVDAAYSFILGRFNRIGIRHPTMDCILLLQSDGTPCIGVNYQKFIKLTPLARVSVIEHQIGHVMSGHLGERLHGNLQQYCRKRFGYAAGDKLYRLVVESAADSFVSYPGALKDNKRTHLDVRKLGLPRWTHTMNILHRIEELVKDSGGGGADQEKTEQLIQLLADKMARSTLWQKGGTEQGQTVMDLSDDADSDQEADLNGDGIFTESADAAAVGEQQLQKTVETALERYPQSKQRGYMRGDAAEFIDAQYKPPEVSWVQRINHSVGSGLSQERRVTRKRLNRRNPEFGFGRVYENVTRICMIVDTSASMGSGELSKVDAELRVLSQLTDDDIDIVHSDAGVAKHTVYRRGMMLREFFGRGGTTFNPALEYVRDELKEKPGLVIFFTDGMGGKLDDEHPILPPWEYRLIWLLTPRGLSEDVFRKRITKLGEVIKVESWK